MSVQYPVEAITASIGENFGDIIQAKNYEKLILEVMNRSAIIFPSQYTHQDSQSNGESDYLDKATGEKYDAKLFFETQECVAIRDKDVEVTDWIKMILEEENEFEEAIFHHRNNEQIIESTALYKLFLKNIERIADDENGIFYAPFPIIEPRPTTAHCMLASDWLDMLYNYWKTKHPKTAKKSLYFITASFNNTVILRKLGKHGDECLLAPELFTKYALFRSSWHIAMRKSM